MYGTKYSFVSQRVNRCRRIARQMQCLADQSRCVGGGITGIAQNGIDVVLSCDLQDPIYVRRAGRDVQVCQMLSRIVGQIVTKDDKIPPLSGFMDSRKLPV